jgi:dipeptide/tripeptide permease
MSTPVDATGTSLKSPADDRGFFGHPRGLSTLFFTEMWERFSFYGLRAILFLYMTKEVAKGGLAFDQPYAGLIMGTYTSGVYWTPLLGGWIADKWLGARRAVLVGGIIIACGHFSMAINTMPNFYMGLALIAIGTGFLKPNVSTMVGDLYDEGDARRDAGFSIFYMGINLGALLAPLIVGYLGQRVEWHYGFGAAGVFMVMGLIQYVLPFSIKFSRTFLIRFFVMFGGFLLGGFIGFLLRPTDAVLKYKVGFRAAITRGGNLQGVDRLLTPLAQTSFNYMLTGALIGLLLGVVLLFLRSALSSSKQASIADNSRDPWVKVIPGHPLGIVGKKVKKDQPDTKQLTSSGEVAAEGLDVITAVLALIGGAVGIWAGLRWNDAGWIGGLFPGVVGAFLGYILGIVRQLNRAEALRVGVIFILFLFAIIFWMSFEQASTSLTLFADKLTHLYFFGYQFPSSWYQSVEPVFVVLLAPVFAAIWVKLGRRNPSSPAKFALGLVFAALAFAIVALASTFVPATGGVELSEALKVGPLWLVAVYFFQALGELGLSPVGLSTVTKVSPGRMVGLMMGVWFLALATGNFLAGKMGGAFDEKKEGALLSMFGTVALITIVAAVVLFAITPLIKKMTPQSA